MMVGERWSLVVEERSAAAEAARVAEIETAREKRLAEVTVIQQELTDMRAMFDG